MMRVGDVERGRKKRRKTQVLNAMAMRDIQLSTRLDSTQLGTHNTGASFSSSRSRAHTARSSVLFSLLFHAPRSGALSRPRSLDLLLHLLEPQLGHTNCLVNLALLHVPRLDTLLLLLLVRDEQLARSLVLHALNRDALLEPLPQLALLVPPDLVVRDVALRRGPGVRARGGRRAAAEKVRVEQQGGEEGDDELWGEERFESVGKGDQGPDGLEEAPIALLWLRGGGRGNDGGFFQRGSFGTLLRLSVAGGGFGAGADFRGDGGAEGGCEGSGVGHLAVVGAFFDGSCSC